MSSGCGTILLFIFWMTAGLYGVGAFTFYVLAAPLWVAIVVPLGLGVVTALFGVSDE